MEWKLFFSTFIIVFLAELGDKTQLTALAASAGAKSPWSVFAGASIALVLSTLVAVLVGSTLTKYVPVRVLKISAGVMFLIFGSILLFTNMKAEAEETAAVTIGLKPGMLVSLIIQSAASIEESAIEEYEQLAQCAENEDLKSLLIELGEKEKIHQSDLGKWEQNYETETLIAENPTEIVSPECFANAGQANDKEILESAITRESQEVEFYQALSKAIHIPVLKTAFLSLASQEREHLAALEEFKQRTQA